MPADAHATETECLEFLMKLSLCIAFAAVHVGLRTWMRTTADRETRHYIYSTCVPLTKSLGRL